MAWHGWKASPGEARALQKALRPMRVLRDSFPPISLVGGVDVAYSASSGLGCCAIAVLTYPGLRLEAVSTASGPVDFPYVPGLLAFREGPLIEQAFGRLDVRPEVLLFDGHGICHPRGVGIATHLGILLNRATVGCAKTPLCCSFEEPCRERGSTSPLTSEGRIVGYALRTRKGVKPVFVSQGHRVSLKTALGLCLACSTRYRIPEPLRQAHIMARQRITAHAATGHR